MTCKKILVFAGMLALCLAGLSGCKDKKEETAAEPTAAVTETPAKTPAPKPTAAVTATPAEEPADLLRREWCTVILPGNRCRRKSDAGVRRLS